MYSLLQSRSQVTRVLGLTLGSILGCGGGGSDKWVAARETVYPVSGIVTYKGEPVDGANVLFHSATKNLTAHAITDADGEYQMTTYEDDDGAVLGEHAVSVRKTVKEPVPSRLDDDSGSGSGETSRLQDLLPKVYASPGTTTLKVTVPEGGSTDTKLELMDE